MIESCLPGRVKTAYSGSPAGCISSPASRAERAQSARPGELTRLGLGLTIRSRTTF